MNRNSTIILLVFIQFAFICLQKRVFLSVLHLLGERLRLSGNLCLCSSWWQEFAQEMNSPLVIELHLWYGLVNTKEIVQELIQIVCGLFFPP